MRDRVSRSRIAILNGLFNALNTLSGPEADGGRCAPFQRGSVAGTSVAMLPLVANPNHSLIPSRVARSGWARANRVTNRRAT